MPEPEAFTHLLQPLTLRRGLRLRNRVVVTAHGTGLSRGGMPTPELAAYHLNRARGGVGLIITEHNSVHPTSRLEHGSTIEAWRDDVIAPYQEMTDAIHQEGGVIFAQLGHAGSLSGPMPDSGYLVAPSAFAALRGDSHVHELTIAEINELVAAYAAAAGRIRESGFDGVEVHLGHGNLVQQFLSPLTNIRTDAYGSDRSRFAAEVITAVASQTGDLEISWRLSADELVPGGLGIDDMLGVIADLLERTGVAPSLLNVSAGQDLDPMSQALHQSPMYISQGHLVPFAAKVRKTFPGIPVNCIGRITEPEYAEQVLAAGEADLVGMTRQHIADPYLVHRIRTGARHTINPCIGCNIACIGRLQAGVHISCIGNPASGRELRLSHLPVSASQPRRVTVVGAGPAGLEAALRAGQQGHRVALFERNTELGGLVRLTRQLPGRGDTGKLIDVRIKQILDDQMIDVNVGEPVSEKDVLATAPDFVVVATGTKPYPLDQLPGRWTSGWATVTEADADPQTPQLVYDDHGDVLGAAFAELLATRGHPVELVYRTSVMPNVETGTRALVLKRLADVGVTVRTDCRIPPKPSGRGVMVGRQLPLDVLSADLTRDGIRHRVVGDALVPRGLEFAILEGRLAIDETLLEQPSKV